VKAFDKVPTRYFWEAIEENARRGQEHTNWVEYLDNIRVLCALIDERIERFQREMRTKQLLQKHRRLDPERPERIVQRSADG